MSIRGTIFSFLMDKPQSHTTDEVGELQMRAVFAHVNWVVNRIERDYGIDFDVQIFEGSKPTGEWFKVQLKSSQSTQYSTAGDFISEALSKDHAVHFSAQLHDPLFLIHADVLAGKTFWFAPQLATMIQPEDQRSTVTFRIPTRNELPTTLSKMVDALRQIRIKLGARQVSESPISDFAKTVNDADQSELISSFQKKTDSLRLNQIHRLATDGKLKEAKEIVEGLLASAASSIEIKFSALLEEERIEYLDAARRRAPQSVMPATRVAIARRLQQLTRKGPHALKLSALLLRNAADLDVLAFRDLGLAMNLKGHISSGDPILALTFAVEQAKNSREIIRKYNQCIRIVRYFYNSRHRWAIAFPLLRVVESVGWFILRLRIANEIDPARQYRASALQLCRFAVWIGEHNRDDDTLSQATTVITSLLWKEDGENESQEIVEFAREVLSKIREPRQAELTEEALERSIKRMSGLKVEGDPEHDVLTQIVENRAAAVGIDMNSSDDVIATQVRLGINDATPERAIKHCTHAFVSLGWAPVAIAALAELLQLPSMLSKILHCDLHNYAVHGQALDGVISRFKDTYCDCCQDVTPRPPEWRYTDEWQEEENKKHLGFMDKFYKTHHER